MLVKTSICSREAQWTNYFGPGYSSVIHSLTHFNKYLLSNYKPSDTLDTEDTAVNKILGLWDALSHKAEPSSMAWWLLSLSLTCVVSDQGSDWMEPLLARSRPSGWGCGRKQRQVPRGPGPSPAVHELGIELRIVSIESEAETETFQILAVTSQTLHICHLSPNALPTPNQSLEGTHSELLSPSPCICPSIITQHCFLFLSFMEMMYNTHQPTASCLPWGHAFGLVHIVTWRSCPLVGQYLTLL